MFVALLVPSMSYLTLYLIIEFYVHDVYNMMYLCVVLLKYHQPAFSSNLLLAIVVACLCIFHSLQTIMFPEYLYYSLDVFSHSDITTSVCLHNTQSLRHLCVTFTILAHTYSCMQNTTLSTIHHTGLS